VTDRCLLCPAPAEDRHHLTGRGDDGRYLDPKLSGPVCHDCHELCGDDLNTIASSTPGSSDTFLGSLELALSRTGAFVGRCSQAFPEPLATLLALLAEHLVTWASRLRASLAALDQNAPGWRAIPGV
jgi:hypothetical protein